MPRNKNNGAKPPCRKFYINATRIAVLGVLSGLPRAGISDIAYRAKRRPGTVGNVLRQFIELGLVQKVDGLSELYCINPKSRKSVEVLCSTFRVLFCGSKKNRRHYRA